MAHIKINDTIPRIQYTATASQTAFTIPFEFFLDEEIKVYEGESETPISDSLYTLTGAGVTGGGTLNYLSGKTAGTLVTITRESSISRTNDFTDGGDWTATNVNDEFDRLTTYVQEVKDLYNRAIKLPVFSSLSNLFFPDAEADKVIGWNSTADALINGPTFDEIANAQTHATVAESARDDAELAETAAENAQSYAEEWANKAEDSLVSAAAGGDGVDDYSAKHFAAKAAASAADADVGNINALTAGVAVAADELAFADVNDSNTVKKGTVADVVDAGLAGAGTNLSVNNNKIIDVTDPTAAQDAATKSYVDSVAIPAIGDVEFTTGNNNPSTKYPGTTWTQIAQGRFIVGVGEGTDANAGNRTYPAGDDSFGEYEHTLTSGEMAHKHKAGVQGDGVNVASPTDNYPWPYGTDGTVSAREVQASTNTETVSVTLTNTPQNVTATAHENAPPAFGLYVWERTA